MIKNNEIEHVLAYNNSNYACNQGSIIKLNNDELFLGYNQERGLIHADSGQSCFIKSNDDGKTWDVNTNKVIWPFNEYQGNWDCAFSQISDGSILMHTRVCSFIKSSALKVNSPQSFGGTTPDKSERLKRQTGYSLLKSYDLGVTWDEPIPVNTSPNSESGFAAYSVGGSGAGHIIELSDGGLLMPLHGSITKEFVAQGGEQARTFVLRSDDKGNNWEYWSTVAHDSSEILSFCEPAMAKLKNGKLICLMRCEVLPGSRFDNMWFVESADDGSSWSSPKRTNLWGYPADIIQLHDDRVLAVYGYRKAPWGVKGCLSDNGVDWDVKNEFDIRIGGVADSNFFQYWHIGYPTVTQCKNKTIVVAYHEYSKGNIPVQEMWVSRFEIK